MCSFTVKKLFYKKCPYTTTGLDSTIICLLRWWFFSNLVLGIIAAIAWPATLLSASSVIDNPWSVCTNRTVSAGRQLAEVLLARQQVHCAKIEYILCGCDSSTFHFKSIHIPSTDLHIEFLAFPQLS